MDIKSYRFMWDSSGQPPQVKFDLLYRQARKDGLAWLVGFWWHQQAQDLASQITTMIDEREAAIAEVDALRASAHEEGRAAEVARAEASPICGNHNAPRVEREAAQRKHAKALQAIRVARNAFRRAEADKDNLRQPLATMKVFRDMLLAVKAPPTRPDFARFLLDMAQGEVEVETVSKRRKRRK